MACTEFINFFCLIKFIIHALYCIFNFISFILQLQNFSLDFYLISIFLLISFLFVSYFPNFSLFFCGPLNFLKTMTLYSLWTICNIYFLRVSYWKIIVLLWWHHFSLFFMFLIYCLCMWRSNHPLQSLVIGFRGEKFSVNPTRDFEAITDFCYKYAYSTLLVPSWVAILKTACLIFFLQKQVGLW